MSQTRSPALVSPSRVLRDRLHRHRAGEPVGVTSICSAHPLVLEAAALQSLEDGGLLLVEATSNQVDQFGGYTGMRPEDFRALVLSNRRDAGLPRERVVLGGDHLGPNRGGPGRDEAMDRAEVLVTEYVAAGFTKIHLDCSMHCADDPSPLPERLVAAAAARLARAADRQPPAAGPADLVYVIGTEVPVPGGAQETIDALTPTSPEEARATLAVHRAAFAEAGVRHAWGHA